MLQWLNNADSSRSFRAARRNDPYPAFDENSQDYKYFTRWQPFWVGIPENMFEHMVGVDLSAGWRKHLIWSKPEGKELTQALTQRFATTTTLLSLLLAVELGTLFSPARPAEEVRVAMKAEHYSVEYFAGAALGLSVFFSISALVANFSAWGIFTVIGDKNLRLIARSSIGLYGATLPSRLVVGVIYIFLLWMILFWYVIFPEYFAISLTVIIVIAIVQIISTYSSMGRIIMSSGAMSPHRIMDKEEEEEFQPKQISAELLRRRRDVQAGGEMPIHLRYRFLNQDIRRRRQFFTRQKPMRLTSALSSVSENTNGTAGKSGIVDETFVAAEDTILDQ